MDLYTQIKRLVQAAKSHKGPPISRTAGLDVLARVQTLLGVLGKDDQQVRQWSQQNKSLIEQKKALRIFRKKFPNTQAEFFSLKDTGTFNKALQSAEQMIRSTKIIDLDGWDVMTNLMMGFSMGESDSDGDMDSGERKMIFPEIGRHLSSGIKKGSTPLRHVGNTAARFAKQAVQTVYDTRVRQRGRRDPVQLQPSPGSGGKQYEVSTFQKLGLRDRFDIIVDILISGSGPTPTDPLGREILKFIYKTIDRLPKRQQVTGRAWFDLLLERSNKAGHMKTWGIGAQLARDLGRTKSTISYAIKRVMLAISNELAKNTKIVDALEERIQQEEMMHGIKLGSRQRRMAAKITRRYLERHNLP